MQATLNPVFYDTHLAPGFSSFHGAVLEDLSSLDAEQEHWLANFALNQLTHSLKPTFRELAFNHIRRTQAALEAYHQLRSLLLTYPPYRRAARRYFNALSQAETCISFAAQACEITNRYMQLAGQIHTHKHVSPIQLRRLHDFYVALKHVPNMLAGSQFKGQDTTVMWFIGIGLQSRRRGTLSFQDLAALLKELADDAVLISNFVASGESGAA